MLRTGTCFKDLGPTHLDQIDPARTTNKLIKRLKELGWDVTLSKTPAADPTVPSC
jgi:hypothetical protein